MRVGMEGNELGKDRGKMRVGSSKIQLGKERS